MSLTSHIADRHSPIRRFFGQHLDDRAARDFVRGLNGEAHLGGQRPPLVVAGTIPTLAGAAFDFGFRHFIEPLAPERPPALAWGGALNARLVGWGRALPILGELLATLAGADADGQARRFVALAAYERFARALGKVVRHEADAGDDLAGSLHADPPDTLDKLLARAPEPTVRDVAALLAMARAEWGWLRGAPFVPNPRFPLSARLGGADADWVLGGTLYECKVSFRERPVERRHVLQLLGYLLLDRDDALGIAGVGFILPRQRAVIRRSVPSFLRGLGLPDDLPALRARFAAVVEALSPDTVR